VLPVNVLASTLAPLLAADTTYLANASAMKVALVANNFSPSIDLLLADLTLFTSGGLAAIAGVAGAQPTSVDPLTGEQVIDIKPPVGGFRWVSSGGTGYPKTVYGFALVDNGIANLLASQRIDTPIILTADGQSINAPDLQLRIDSTQIQ